MEIEDFETLVECCQIFVGDDNRVYFQPYSAKSEHKVLKILIENDLTDVSPETFCKICEENSALYQARKKAKKQKLEEYTALSPEEISRLPMEKKVDYLELLFPQNQTRQELETVLPPNEENLRACLFHLDFPKSFWDEEKKYAERYASLVANSSEITNKLKNWNKTRLEEKKEVIQEAFKIFEYVYGGAPEVEFFTEEQERKSKIEAGYPEDIHINAACYRNGLIRFNEDRLQTCDNLFAISVPFHEGTHFRQDYQQFDDPLINRIFKSATNNATVYEDRLNLKESINYKDLYSMMPFEIHAYGLQEYMESVFLEKSGIEKTQSYVAPEAKKIQNKGFNMAKINQYRSR